MALIKIKDDNVIMTKKEKILFFELVGRHLDLMPKAYRKRNCNWVVIKNLTWHGSTYSRLICEAVGVDPSSHKWEVLENVNGS